MSMQDFMIEAVWATWPD